MKKRIIYFFTIAAIVSACGAPEEDANLVELETKRDSLKSALAEVNEEIEKLDTVSVVEAPIVTSSKVKVENFVHKIQVPGTVETDQNAVINAESSGAIKRIHVKEGQTVSKGQTLITIDSEILAANMAELETSLELAEYMLEKQQKLMDAGVGVEIEFEQARNQKLALEKRMKTLRSQTGKTVVRAPFSGTVDDIFVNMGEMAAPQVPLMRIVNNKTVTVNASLSENLLAKINVGTQVEMKFSSLNDTIIRTVVTNKGNYIDPTNRTFRIQMEVKNNTLLLPNQFADVQVTDFRKADAKVVPSQAIVQDVENRNYVYRLTPADEGGLYNVEKIFITIIKKFDGMVCIEGDIQDGDLLVEKGAKGITELDKVQIQ